MNLDQMASPDQNDDAADDVLNANRWQLPTTAQVAAP
jgi:hypothetical protein